MPLFSVIIPTKNRPEFLKAAVASVLGQSLSDLELLVINDGDPLAHNHHDHRFHIVQNDGHGAVRARNTGISHARGQYIAFLDDDDWWSEEDHLAQALKALTGNAAFYFADGLLIYSNGEPSRSFAQTANASSLETDNTILISAVAYRHSLHRELGQFDESLPYYWDWDWYLRVARSAHVLFHQPQPAVHIRVHAANMSGQDNREQRQHNLEAFAKKHHIATPLLKNHTDFAR